jgi:hypothetical protein
MSKATAYMIFMDARTSEVLAAKRHRIGPMILAETRKRMEAAFPGRRIFSHMEAVPSKEFADESVRLVTVYLSRNKNGHGRIANPFETWAVVE